MNTVEALLAVKDTVNDLGNFCERNSDTCKTGKTFFGSLGERARDGARIAYEYLDRTFGSDKGENKLPPENINTGSITPENDHEDHLNKVDNKKVDNKNGSIKSVTPSAAGHKQPVEPEEKKMPPSQKPQ